MALKFDMGDSAWARQMAYQQNQKMASTLGEDIGTAFGMGAAAIAGKAKKRFGAKYAKAHEKHKAEVEKTGVEKDFMSMAEFRVFDKKQKRDTKRKKHLRSKLKDSGLYDEAYQGYKDVLERDNKKEGKGKYYNLLSQKDFESNRSLAELERYNKVRKDRKAGKIGDMAKGILGAGASTIAAPFALTGSALSNIFNKKDKRDPITSDPTQNPFNFPIGDEDVPEAEQAEHDKGYVSEGEATENDVNQAYRDQYNSTGRAPTLAKTQSDYYTRGPVSMRTGRLAREEGMPMGINPLVNPNTTGLPFSQNMNLSTGTEEEMLRNREVLTGSNVALPTGPDPLGEGYSLGNQSGESILMGRGDATPGTLVGEDGSYQDSSYNYDRTKDMSAVDQQRFAQVEAQYGKDWENTLGEEDKQQIYEYLNPTKRDEFKPTVSRSNFLEFKPFGVY